MIYNHAISTVERKRVHILYFLPFTHLEMNNLTLDSVSGFVPFTFSLMIFVLLCRSHAFVFNSSAKSYLLKISTLFIDYYKKG